MLHSLNDITLTSSKGTIGNLEAIIYFLNYSASNQDTEIFYKVSVMRLIVDIDGEYLVDPQTRSRQGGYHYISNNEGILLNRPIYVLKY